MYLVTLIGDARSFFTDTDPTLPPTGHSRFTMDAKFATCKRAEFKDSYTPSDGVKQQREADAREAFATGSTRTVRINPDAVASSIEIS